MNDIRCLDIGWTNYAHPATVNTIVTGILGDNKIFSDEEREKLKKAYDLIKEVRDNYRETHFELRSKIK